jgi:hypothetical protein
MAKPQTRHGIPPEFLDAADQFVQLANRQTDEASREWVAAAMLYAAARFHAFAWLTREERPDQTADQASAYFASEFDKMFRDNVEELAPHYPPAAAPAAPQ